jgi:HD-GYP domain-containing protein (c-di-GMP phosphodiesterase class II)
MQKQQIAVEDLEIGMFVVELDRPWLGTPFDFRGFSIATHEQLDRLRVCCRTVCVDPERRSGSTGPAPRRVVPAAPPAHSTSLEEELPAARAIYEHCAHAARVTLAHLRSDGELEPEKLADAVGKVAQSMRRNPDAMLLLDSVREKSDRQTERALNSSILMMAFGRFLDFDAERLEVLGLAGLLLDVGKNCVPDGVLEKAGMLTPDEYRHVKQHVVHSAELVRAADGRFPDGLEEIILEHHERRDGSGYPRGLDGGRISVEGSIAGIVDSFSALTLPRAFAEPRAPASALNLLDTMRGKCFDDTLMDQFIQCVGAVPVGSPVELTTGETAIVISANRVQPLAPRVMIVLDREGSEAPRPYRIVDLAEDAETDGREPYRIRRPLPISRLPLQATEHVMERLCGKGGSGAALGSLRPTAQ